MPESERWNFNVGKGRWSAFFLCCGKNNTILLNLRNILFEYWKTHNIMLDYFLIDYIIKMCEQNCASAKAMIEAVPINNVHIHDLQPIMFETFNEQKFNKLTKDTGLFKLSYKFDKENLKVPNSFYKHLINKK